MVTALAAFAVNLAVENISGFKFWATLTIMERGDVLGSYLAYTAMNAALVGASVAITLYVGPAAAGSGIADVKVRVQGAGEGAGEGEGEGGRVVYSHPKATRTQNQGWRWRRLGEVVGREGRGGGCATASKRCMWGCHDVQGSKGNALGMRCG